KPREENEIEIEQMQAEWRRGGDSNPRPATTAMNKNTSTPLIIFVFLSRFAQRRHPEISLPYPSKTCINRNGFASQTGGAKWSKGRYASIAAISAVTYACRTDGPILRMAVVSAGAGSYLGSRRPAQ